MTALGAGGARRLVCSLVGEDFAVPLAQVHGEAFDHPWSAEALAPLIAGPGAFAIAAVLDDGLTGFVIARALAGEAEIVTLGVKREARRGGVGRALMAEAIATALALQAEVMWLEVAVDNAAAIGLYQALDFATAGRRKNYYARRGGDRIDALIMRRALNSAAG